ncbi:MAG TPA: CbiX/SirB N-terminal domain-containing protein [Burkholderiaceae bacterium]|nr:CbiX/SirB N-terminal domain-containing protein [Burkholderiaceae bacterium]
MTRMRHPSTDLPDALVLFAHGARDARWSQTLSQLADAIRALAAAEAPGRELHVSTAFLEFQPPTLQDALDQAMRDGARRIDILPVFWASGGHVANDVPPLLAAFRASHPALQLRMLPVLSELPGMLDFIAAGALRGGR